MSYSFPCQIHSDLMNGSYLLHLSRSFFFPLYLFHPQNLFLHLSCLFLFPFHMWLWTTRKEKSSSFFFLASSDICWISSQSPKYIIHISLIFLQLLPFNFKIIFLLWIRVFICRVVLIISSGPVTAMPPLRQPRFSIRRRTIILSTIFWIWLLRSRR